jgi:vancomycin resistance protein YoaR
MYRSSNIKTKIAVIFGIVGGAIAVAVLTYVVCNISFKGQLATVEYKNDNYETKIAELEEDNDRLNNLISEHGLNAVDDYTSQIEDLQDQLSSKTTEATDLKNENDYLKQQAIDYSSEIADLNSQVTILESGSSALEELQAKSDADDEKIQALEDQVDELNGTITTLNDTVAKLRNETDSVVVLGEYSVKAPASGSAKYNIRNAVGTINGLQIEEGSTVSIRDSLGGITAENMYYEVDDTGYATGLAYLTEAIYRCALKSELHVTEFTASSNQYVYVSNDVDLKIENTKQYTIEIWATYSSDGVINIKILGV